MTNEKIKINWNVRIVTNFKSNEEERVGEFSRLEMKIKRDSV